MFSLYPFYLWKRRGRGGEGRGVLFEGSSCLTLWPREWAFIWGRSPIRAWALIRGNAVTQSTLLCSIDCFFLWQTRRPMWSSHVPVAFNSSSSFFKSLFSFMSLSSSIWRTFSVKPSGSPIASFPLTSRSSTRKMKNSVAHKDLEWCHLLCTNQDFTISTHNSRSHLQCKVIWGWMQDLYLHISFPNSSRRKNKRNLRDNR